MNLSQSKEEKQTKWTRVTKHQRKILIYTNVTKFLTFVAHLSEDCETSNDPECNHFAQAADEKMAAPLCFQVREIFLLQPR